jgi:putative oxidoreductase
MIKKIFSPDPLWSDYGLVAIRILTGLLMAYHGAEIFNRTAMEVYLTWDVIKGLPAPELMVYVGKGIEFFAGVCLAVGLFTRIASLFMVIDMLFICFKIGNGRFYYEDQHPFLFALIALIFFFTGPVKWALDFSIFKKTK